MNNVSSFRIKAGKSQETLANEASISRTYLSEIENGKKIPSCDIAYKIAVALNSTVEEIFFTPCVNYSELIS